MIYCIFFESEIKIKTSETSNAFVLIFLCNIILVLDPKRTVPNWNTKRTVPNGTLF